MIIRDVQMAMLADHARRSFCQRVMNTLRADFSEDLTETSDPELQALVEECFARAQTHGILAEKDVAEFIILMFCMRRIFADAAEAPWVEELLNRSDLRGGVKVLQLRARAKQESDRRDRH